MQIFLTLTLISATTVADYPFRNTSLPWKERVDDLVSRLTLEEIKEQMSRGGGGPKGGPAPAIARLGIAPYSWDTECLHGDAGAGNATSFPQAIGLAATFRYLYFKCPVLGLLVWLSKHQTRWLNSVWRVNKNILFDCFITFAELCQIRYNFFEFWNILR